MRHLGHALALLPLFTLAACGAPDDEVDDRVGEVAEALTVCPGKDTVKGVDVSYYQGSIDWGKVKNAGIGFGIARIGDGTFVDPKFDANWHAMKKVGMVRGAYQFFRSDDDPHTLANIVVSHVGKLGVGDLPVTLDVEASDGASQSTMVNKIKVWMDKVEAGTGRKPMIYTGAYFWNSAVGSTGFSGYPLWVANWGVSCPSLPNGWKGFRVWQTTDSGSVPGIPGAVDRDLFNGTKAELLAFASPPNAPPKGKLEDAACKAGIAGWAQDPDTPAKSIDVALFFDAAAGKPGAIKVTRAADDHRDDLCAALGSCNHGFAMPVPRGLRDGDGHPVHAYGVDSDGGPKAELKASPASFTCQAPALPLDATHGELRKVKSGVMAAWRFSKLFNLAHEADATLAPYAKGDAWPLEPTVLQEDGANDAWVVDGTTRRHAGGAALKAWRLADAAKKATAAEIAAYTEAEPLPPEPFLVAGTDGAIFVVDYAEPADWAFDGALVPGEEEQDGSLDTDVPADATPAADTPEAGADDTAEMASCSVSAPGRGPLNGAGGVLGLVALALAARLADAARGRRLLAR